jgi:hypothetical protein
MRGILKERDTDLGVKHFQVSLLDPSQDVPSCKSLPVQHLPHLLFKFNISYLANVPLLLACNHMTNPILT